MVTVPLLVDDSDLNGWNFPPSDFSASLSGFLSGGFGAAGAASQERRQCQRKSHTQASAEFESIHVVLQ